ncbi:HAMP domain-containing histidine kinase [Glycomyces sp. TRM65418]|uniref:MtrAB system histidine kinase MtrB n=1 Tax=Glycomyces sp. TRM65418 TaxID=2867006 RepID=UPI001CE5641A|nr:MtrAB system histidine kinase MtrB [Glycomyces sp. TRM65418]MCC3762859.1 HAMP domain-containing histidine kinase [Glycomyces sp. TRM65418]QZD56886.1 HAMP domain-containing histidine kinase [Glycomyces sp. TRM65418]
MWLRRLGQGAARVADRVSRPLIERFAASLQLRVVASTLIASTILVLIFSFVVAGSVTSGLLDERQDTAVDETGNAAERAAEQLGTYSSSSDTALATTLQQIANELAEDPAYAPYIMLRTADGDVTKTHPIAGDVRSSDDLQAAVADRKVASQYADLDVEGDGDFLPYLVVGSYIDVGIGYEIYAFYPLESQQDAISLLRTNLALAGVALVLLLGVIAALVTRLVVTPVREAARTSQRLAAGLLHERMEVRGSDDLARLAGSFNLMAENLQSQIRRLEEMSMMQRRFTSDVSHELRTPLATIRMAADLLYDNRDDFDPVTKRSIELLQHEIDRFEDLLQELLEISRFDSGFASLEVDAVDVGRIAEDVVTGLSRLAGECGVEVTVEKPPRRVIAEVDPRRVQRILRNLVSNAIEHAEGRPVEIRVAESDTAVAVAVRDHGVGLKPGHADRVFDRFWRADPSRNRKTGGTGLGLAISLEDAKLHSGTLKAAGEPGKGTLFVLTLPLQAGNRVITSPIPLRFEEPKEAPHATQD